MARFKPLQGRQRNKLETRASVPSVSEMERADRRAGLYESAAWRRNRLLFLQAHPLCVFCQRAGAVEPATVVDHIIPHKGGAALFWDVSNWQSLCKKCHDGEKKRLENAYFLGKIGAAGLRG